MASYPSYLPTTDEALAAWLDNFSTLITAAPADYGLQAADATAIANATTPFGPALTLATDPITRTAPSIASKDAARAVALAVVRPYAVRVSLNNAVTNAAKAALGVTIRSNIPTPIPAPVDAPSMGLRSMTPGVALLGYSVTGSDGKAKPFGVTGLEVWTSVGEVHATDPDQCTYNSTVTRSPFRLAFPATQAGKKLTVFSRFVTRTGPGGVAQRGPWSLPLQTVIV